MTPFDLILACSPLIAPVTMSAVIQQESGGNPLALHDNTTGVSYQPRTQAEAIVLAHQLIESGHSIDLGMTQINSKNLPWLNQSVETIFNPCFNLTAAQTVLIAAWKQSNSNLPGTLSAYNTGKVSSSVGANYAASVYAKTLHPTSAPIVPAIPNGKLPGWISQQIPGTQNINPNDLAKTTLDMTQSLQAVAAMQAKPVRAIMRVPKQSSETVTPANSPLKPDEGDLMLRQRN